MNQLKKVNNITTTDARNLSKKTDYSTKINEIETDVTDHNNDKYITTQKINTLTSENFAQDQQKQIQ